MPRARAETKKEDGGAATAQEEKLTRSWAGAEERRCGPRAAGYAIQPVKVKQGPEPLLEDWGRLAVNFTPAAGVQDAACIGWNAPDSIRRHP
jgi:hypothetical protein